MADAEDLDAILPAPEEAQPIPTPAFRQIPRTLFTIRPHRLPAIFQERPIGLNDLHKAALRGDYVHAESLVNTPVPKYDINERVPSDSPTLGGFTSLLLGAAIDRDHIVRLLLHHGADPQARTLEGVSALHLAVESRHKQQPDYNPNCLALKDLTANWLESRMGINSPVVHSTVNNTQFHVTVRLLIAAGININTRDEWGFTPLHRACNVYSPDSLIRLLIHSGANVNARSRTGATPLHVAAETDHRKTAKMLIRYGAYVNAVTNEHRLTPLHLAVIHQNRRMIKLLLRHGANLRARTSEGYMAIHLAALSDNTDPLPCLLRRGAPLDVPAGEDNQTPMHMACRRANDVVLKYLLRAGANVHSRCKKGLTPMHVLIITTPDHWGPPHYTANMIDYLMRTGADINIRDPEGRTALHFACLVDATDVTPYLLAWNANMFAKDQYNRVPLDYCKPESLSDFRSIFWPYVYRLRCLLPRPISHDTWPKMKTKYYIHKVRQDLRAMADYHVGEDCTIMDLVLKSTREVSCRVTSEQLQLIERLIFVEGRRHFPMYYVVIGQKIQAIADEKEKRKLARPAGKALSKLIGWQIPEDCSDHIFEYLHASDMTNLIAAGEHPFVAFMKIFVRGFPPDTSISQGTNRADMIYPPFSWWNIENEYESIYSPYPSCWV